MTPAATRLTEAARVLADYGDRLPTDAKVQAIRQILDALPTVDREAARLLVSEFLAEVHDRLKAAEPNRNGCSRDHKTQ